jgi:transcription elongation factor B subunit 2
MYVRVKRFKTTSFLHVEPTDTISSVKAKLQDLLQQAPERQQLYKDSTLLEDDRSLAELKIETDDALTLVLQQEGKRER